MSAAWSRFDAEVQQVKRLCSHISGQGVLSTPATLWTHSRRQSAANRRAIGSSRSNVRPRSALTAGMYRPEMLTSPLTDAGTQSHALPQLLQCAPTMVEMSLPCVSSTTYSTSVIVSSSRVRPPTICSTHTASGDDTPQPDIVASSIDSELDTVHVTWTDPPCAWSQSHQLDQSTHSVMSDGDISTLSTVTSEAFTDVSTAQQSSHCVSTLDKSSPSTCQLSTLNTRDIEGW